MDTSTTCWFIRCFRQSKRISYHRGRKQRYLISCFSPVLSFALALTSKTRGKKAISPNLKLNVRSRTDCSEPLPDCSPCIALEWSSSTVVGAGSQATTIADYLAFCRLLALKLPSVDESLRSDAMMDHANARFAVNSCIGGQILQEQMSNLHEKKLGRIPLLQGKQTKQVKSVHRSMWRQAQPIYVLVHPLLLQKRTYLISSGTKASHTHIMQSPCPFLCPHSCPQDKDKEKQYVGTSTQTPRKMPHLPGEQIRQAGEASTLKHVETSATNIYVLVHPLLLQRQTYLISSGSKAKVFHIMLFPFLSFTLALTWKTEGKKAISQNLKSNVRSGTDCLEPFAWLLTEPCSQVLIFKFSEGPVKRKRLRTTSVMQKKQAEKNAA